MGHKDPATILVVDDDADLLAGYAFAIETRGYRVLLAQSGHQALALARAQSPDVLVTDIVMPVMDGFELIGRLRAELGDRAPPAIVCSGFDITEEEAVRRGAQLFLPKPADLETLLGAIRSLLGRTALSADSLSRQRTLAQEERSRIRLTAHNELDDLEEEETARRARPWLDWLRAYLGCAGAGVLLLRSGGLQPIVGSGTFSGDGPARSFLENNVSAVVETLTSLVVGDARRHPSFRQTLAPGADVAFFAGVPLLIPVDVAVGAICVCDPEPRRFEAESLVQLEHLGRRGASQLVVRQRHPSWPESSHQAPLLTRASFLTLLCSELKLAWRTHHTVELAMVRVPSGVSLQACALELWRAGAGPRTALGAFPPDQLAFFKAGGGRDVARQVASGLQSVRDRGLLEAAGVVSAAGAAGLNDVSLVQLAENALLSSTAGEGGGQRRIVVRPEASRAWP
jgi:CheY-like chemotaxis protein